jgi:peptidoglycan hydrolase-like protein with peptidoglycan-binding domain
VVDGGRRVVAAGVTTLVALLLVACTAAGTVAVLTAPRPDLLADAQPLGEVPVAPHAFTDPRPVRVALTPAEPQPLVGYAPGTVTASWCTPGAELTSGAPLLEVDGTAVMALATRTPMWRDLSAGQRGDDVRAVQDELARLGFAGSESGRVDRATVAALRAFTQAHGITLARGGPLLPRASVVWLPGESVVVDECDLVIGGEVVAGDRVAVLAAPLVRAVATMPPGMAPGARALMLDGAVIPVPADGVVDGAEALTALSSTESYRAAHAAGETSLTGTLLLAEPLEVISVPATAVYGEDGTGAACVRADGRERSVQVVASELGQTMVTIAGDTPSVVSGVADRTASCGSS